MADNDDPTGDTPRPTTEAEAELDEAKDEEPQGDSKITDEQWDAMYNTLQLVYDHRTADGHDPSKVFHKKVNKRIVPDYYDIIKEPIAMSTIKARLNVKYYKDFSQYVRDFALIPHNAQVYNLPGAGAYFDALEVKKLLEDELKKYAEKGVITVEEAQLPYLGEIPEADVPIDQQEGGEDDEEDEDEDADDSDDSQGKRSKKRGRKSTRREDSADAAQAAETDPRKRRGRPPKVDTPMEARIKNILKNMRRPKSDEGYPRIDHFERLPDKAAEPHYYAEIRQPVAIDMLKKKLKRKKYNTVEQFMADVRLMFENAKRYNVEDSIIYKDAVALQEETQQFAKIEMDKPDSEFASEDGKIPLPNGVEHNGQVYKIGDWVHIQNPNDLSKPIPAQLYRTWKDVQGNQFVNACWYYRPEQTVHRFDKHFFDHEIVKTGQYRDHSVDEIIDRCFIMFITRYNKGRPRGFPEDKQIYVCESRYNEEKLTFNKIKTWASCLPDEMRDKDYEMDIFPQPKRLKKKPSPIAYLIKDEQKDSDELPQPVWGSENAPPTIGAVHRRPREPKDSPPPERTPTPPPKLPTPPPPPPRTTPAANQPTMDGVSRTQPNGYPSNTAPRQPSVSNPTLPPQQRSYQMAAASPTPQTSAAPQFNRAYSSTAQGPAYNQRPLQPPPPPQGYPPQRPGVPLSYPSQQNYSAPQPIEAWFLPDHANAQIPRDIAAQFNRDDHGRVLFFTAPPVDVAVASELGELGHSAKYLATKRERDEERKRKRKERDEAQVAEAERRVKVARAEANEYLEKSNELGTKALDLWSTSMAAETIKELQSLYGDRWTDVLRARIQAR